MSHPIFSINLQILFKYFFLEFQITLKDLELLYTQLFISQNKSQNFGRFHEMKN